MGFQTLFVVITVLISIVISKPYDVTSILENIPDKERIQFLKHHIQLGYELATEKDNTISNLPILSDLPKLPKEFSLALYKYTRQAYRIDNEKLASVLGNIICFPNGECIDVGDVGVHPRNLNNK